MPIDKATVQKNARLARIAVTEADIEYFAPQLDNIIGWAEMLQNANTEGIEPLASVSEINLRLRPDAVTDGNCPDKVLANAPETVEGFFVVSKIIE